MSYFYLDSSALVKRYLTEIGSAWVGVLTDPAVGNSIVVAEITRVERRRQLRHAIAPAAAFRATSATRWLACCCATSIPSA